MYFARNLKILMEQKGISNYQLAKEAGCHQSNVAYWLEGTRHPQKRMIYKVAEVLGVHPIDITDIDISDTSIEIRPFSKPTDYELVSRAIKNQRRKAEDGQKEKPTTPECSELNLSDMELLSAFKRSDEATQELIRRVLGLK